MTTQSGNPNIDVQKLGQSFWYDNIQRSIIASGELQTLIKDFGVLGVTSNPAIFEKAIAGSADYDADIATLASEGASTNTIYETLAIADIQAAADILEPVFEQTNGLDGYISLEVSPTLARDADGTIKEARRLHKAVSRKNLMVKVPATPECIPAIETLIADGININVTLIFSLDGYEQVARAYIAGLAARAKKHQPLNVASVASFFVSRVDVLIDKQLDEKIAAAENDDQKAALTALKGKAAIANAKLAYEAFERIFAEPEFASLAAAGARAQRVLWASTSTKNPAYKDTYYLEALIGKDTVDTVPPAALKAFRDHGVVAPALHDGLDQAKDVLSGLAAVGVDMQVAWLKLQDDGVKLFADAFTTLMASIDNKRASVQARGEVSGAPVGLKYVDELVKMKAASRVWARDAGLWTADPEHIKVVSNRLGWLQVIDSMRTKVAELVEFREQVKALGLTEVIVLGMGGSSLAPDVLRASFGPQADGLRVRVLDTTDPTTILGLEASLDMTKALFLVSSKSGTTIEANSFYKYFRAKLDTLLAEEAGKHFVAITDEGTSLQAMAVTENFGRVFVNPSDIGGRYSALSYFGLVPAVLQGIDMEKLLARASQMAKWCAADSPANPGLWLGGLMGGMALNGQDKVSLIISPAILTFGGWAEQLIAESTGKNGRGIVPVEGDLAGEDGPFRATPTAVSADRLMVHLKLRDDTVNDKFVAAIAKDGHPVITIVVQDVYDLGAEFFRWEFATAIAGAVIGVDPFDEPNVTESKQNTKRLLDEFEATGVFANEATSKSANGQINKFSRTAKKGDYISVQAYLPYEPEVAASLQKLRIALREKTGVPVTVGFGPRFLHSTGQLHKGGGNNVVAVQLTYDPDNDALVPGEPYSLSTLIRAQALGDNESLHAHNRRVIRLHLGHDLGAGFRKLLKAVSGGTRRPRAAAAAAPAGEAAPAVEPKAPAKKKTTVKKAN